MALTVNTVPANISNSGIHNVTTSLVEDATHVNLRVRADITVSAVIVAVVEKPKGIADFDFGDILKSLVPGLFYARNTGNIIAVPGGGGEATSSPLISYTVTFTEVWEDVGVTTTGDTDISGTLRYVPAKGDGTAFTEYVMHDDACLFANKTLRNNVTKFFTVNPLEYFLIMFTEVVHCELFYSKDGGAYDHVTHFDPSNGWAVIIINIGELMSSVTSNLRLQVGELGGVKISEVLTIYVDNSQIDERVVLEFDGLVGGKEYLAFAGRKEINHVTDRKYYKSSAMVNKLLSVTGKKKQVLETRFIDMNNAAYLESLLDSEIVKKLEISYAAPKEVTILTEAVKISSSEMFTNPIEIEY